MNTSTRLLAAPVSPRLTRVSRRASSSSNYAKGQLQIKRDPLRIALFILTILTISRVHQAYPLLEKFRPALLLVVASVGYAYLNPRYLASNPLRLWPMRLVGILGILACCSVVFGISLGGSALFILDSYVKTLAYAFLIAVSIRQVRDLYTFVWAYVLSCGILSLFSLFVFGISREYNSYVTRLNNLYTYDSNDLGVVMMVGFPLTLLLLTVERGTKRLFLAAILIGIAATMARSGSRGGFLGFAAVGLGGLILVKDVSAARRLFVLTGASIVLAVGAPDGYWKQMGTMLAPKADYNYSDIDGRKAVMERGIAYMAEYPVFGLGISNFSRAECSISPKLALLRRNGPMRCTPPHNSYLEAGAELGVPGLFIYLSLVMGGIFAPPLLRRRLPKSWRHGTQSERFIYSATSFFALAMIGFAVTSFFVSFAWMDPIYFMAAMITGLYVVARAQVRAGATSGDRASSCTSSRKVSGWRVSQSFRHRIA